MLSEKLLGTVGHCEVLRVEYASGVITIAIDPTDEDHDVEFSLENARKLLDILNHEVGGTESGEGE